MMRYMLENLQEILLKTEKQIWDKDVKNHDMQGKLEKKRRASGRRCKVEKERYEDEESDNPLPLVSHVNDTSDEDNSSSYSDSDSDSDLSTIKSNNF